MRPILSKWLLSVLLAGLAASGCGVSRSVVAQKDAELSQCRESLAGATEEAEATKAQISALNGKLADAEKRGAQKVAALEAQAAEQKKAEDAAVAGLEDAKGQLRGVEQKLTKCRQEGEARLRETEELCGERVASLEESEARLRRELESEISERNVEIAQLRDSLTVTLLDVITFESGSTEILPRGKAVLDKIAGVLAAAPGRVSVKGHTDDLPIRESAKERFPSNWELSAARAASVIRYFQFAHGIAPERMEVVGLSMYSPIDPGASEAGRAKNRRVEIVLWGEATVDPGLVTVP